MQVIDMQRCENRVRNAINNTPKYKKERKICFCSVHILYIQLLYHGSQSNSQQLLHILFDFIKKQFGRISITLHKSCLPFKIITIIIFFFSL